MRPRSNTLFHFTRSLESLKSILLEGFWPRYCLEDLTWQMPGGKPQVYAAFPMVCFCDIPLSRIDEHVAFYGNFGIGMTRDWAVRNGVSPLMYVPSHNEVAKAMMSISKIASKSRSEKLKTGLLASLRHIAMHMKPASGTMVVAGEPVAKDFYQESEWRFIASERLENRYLRSDVFSDAKKLLAANEESRKNCTLRFSPGDVRYIFVKSDSDIPYLMNFIQSDMDKHAGSDIKILMSRVVSLESIRNDW